MRLYKCNEKTSEGGAGAIEGVGKAVFAVGVFEPFNPFLHLILLPGTSSVLRFVLDTPEIFVKFLPGKGLSLLFNLNGALLDHLHLNGFRLIVFVEVED